MLISSYCNIISAFERIGGRFELYSGISKKPNQLHQYYI